MVRSGTPKHLRDISNLYLSQHKSVTDTSPARGEAAVWLLFGSRRFNRAYIAAGVSYELTRQGMHVTLLEIGRGLPNIGYYFALDPEDYLAPTIDGGSILSGVYGNSLRYVYAAEPDPLVVGGVAPGAPVFPHVAVSALYLTPETGQMSYLRRMQLCSQRLLHLCDRGTKPPDAVVVIDEQSASARRRSLMETIGAISESSIVLHAGFSADASAQGHAEELIRIPADIQVQMARRVPPSGGFFASLLSSVLQILSCRRRRVGNDAACT